MPHFLVSRLNHPPFPFTKSPTQLVSRLHTECTYHRFRSYLSGTPKALVGIYQKSCNAWSKNKHRLHVVSFKVHSMRISSRQSEQIKEPFEQGPSLSLMQIDCTTTVSCHLQEIIEFQGFITSGWVVFFFHLSESTNP